MTYLQFGVMGNRAYAGGTGKESGLPNAVLILPQRVRGPVPIIEIAYKNGLSGIRCPFSVNDGAVLFDVETKFEVPFSERVVAPFVILYGFLPPCE